MYTVIFKKDMIGSQFKCLYNVLKLIQNDHHETSGLQINS